MPRRQFYVDFPTGSACRDQWCDTLDEAKALAERFIDQGPVILIHEPIFEADGGELVRTDGDSYRPPRLR